MVTRVLHPQMLIGIRMALSVKQQGHTDLMQPLGGTFTMGHTCKRALFG